MILWFWLVGCATVPAYQRGLLFTPVMVPPSDTAFVQHVHEVREGMAGAEPGGGASCGCN